MIAKNAPVCVRAQSPIPPTGTGAPVCGRVRVLRFEPAQNLRRTCEPAQEVSR